MEILMLVLQVTMPRPMLGGKILMPSLMRFVELSVKPTVLPLCHGAFMPRLMRIAQVLVLFSVFCIEVSMLFTVFYIEVLMLSPVLSLFVMSKA